MIDIRHTPTGDIDLSGGDISYTESTLQHQRDILLAGPGSYKSAPSIGVNVREELDNENPQEMLRKIRREFARDGMKINALSYDDKKLNIDAEYRNSEKPELTRS